MRCTFTVYVDSPDGGRMPVRVTVAAGDTQPETYANARAEAERRGHTNPVVNAFSGSEEPRS